MPTELTRVYVPFSDVQKSTIKGADGKDIDIRLVKGLMTDESLDLDGQKVDAAWAKGAAQKWFSRWGNIREQHSSNAIGKSVALDVLDASKAIDMTGKVVDPLSIIKIDEEILSGWSVGIKGARVVKDATAPNGRIVGGEIVEVSLVDHPANENCKVALVKAAKNGKLADVEQEVIEKIAAADETKLAGTDTEKTVVQVTVWADDDVQVTGDAANPLEGTEAEPEAARVDSAIDADLGGSLIPVASTGDKSPEPEITKSEEDIEAMYAKAFPQLKDLLSKGDTTAALALIAATEVLSKQAAEKPTEPIVESVTETPAAEADATKAAEPDTMKAAISEAVSKAVETALKPLREKVESMEKRAAPGGPQLGPSKLLSAGDQVLGAVVKERIAQLEDMAQNDTDAMARQGAKQLLAELTKAS
jgi:hypothetical protein